MASGSMTKTKSKPKTRGHRKTFSNPWRASGIKVRGRMAVAVPMSTAHSERKGLDRRLARGMVNEPTMGIRIVRRTMVSAFIVTILFLI
jgi:hypothetical protein